MGIAPLISRNGTMIMEDLCFFRRYCLLPVSRNGTMIMKDPVSLKTLSVKMLQVLLTN